MDRIYRIKDLSCPSCPSLLIILPLCRFSSVSLTRSLTLAVLLPAPEGQSPRRVEQTAQARRLHETHHAHVAVAEAEEREEWNRAPHPHMRGVGDGEQEVEREGELECGEPAAPALVLLALPTLVARALDPVLRRADELGSDAEERFEDSARVREGEADAESHDERQVKEAAGRARAGEIPQ